MSKKTASFRLDENILLLLDKLAEQHKRSKANMLEVLIEAAAKAERMSS